MTEPADGSMVLAIASERSVDGALHFLIRAGGPPRRIAMKGPAGVLGFQEHLGGSWGGSRRPPESTGSF
jgi:hypothetical protein